MKEKQPFPGATKGTEGRRKLGVGFLAAPALQAEGKAGVLPKPGPGTAVGPLAGTA